MTSVSATEREEANKNTANIITRLLTESCRPEARKALKYEGPITLQTSFKVLGKVAGQEMFASPEVSAGMSGLVKHLDEEKLKVLLKP